MPRRSYGPPPPPAPPRQVKQPSDAPWVIALFVAAVAFAVAVDLRWF